MGFKSVHIPQQKTNGHGLLLIRQQLEVCRASGIVNGNMNFLIASAKAGSKTQITGDQVPDGLKTGHMFDDDMDHVAGVGPLVAAKGLCGLQIREPAETQVVEHPTHG
ncbi:hypothetical protein KBY65_13665 [Cyanobium sp. Alchichica 3B3-8F6]|uniref:hypothetical protein n=1 Tax=Cyanobium sp. Alchichica 3B3-8F6 TaxID=2823696 RepID=UPI0020CCFC79|nr:hypothetical protein [Cyanobium sp. Alchichica 3B3-8F6]MCP9883499.1 hypothetical protein [Cyanobium sp. Alchichica 3B3-8F6]